MPVTARHLAVAGVLAATAVAVPAAALAGSNSSSKPPSTPAHTVTAVASAGHAKAQGGARSVSLSAVAARLASRLGVSTSAAEHALQQLQGNVTSSHLAAIAHELGVTPARLSTALREVKMSFAPPGSDAAKPGRSQGEITVQAVAARLASRLGVSTSTAQHALQQLQGRVVTSSRLAAIAHELGVTRAQLTNALRDVKMSFAPPGTRGAQKGRGPSLTTLPAAAAALASRLGVSMSAAQHALHQLGVISAREGGVESTSPQFRAIARELGVSTARLDNALRAVKESFAGR